MQMKQKVTKSTYVNGIDCLIAMIVLRILINVAFDVIFFQVLILDESQLIEK